MKYIKKPIIIEAFCPATDEWPEWFNKSNYSITMELSEAKIHFPTLDGDISCSKNDYIIRGIEGEIYPCRREIFLQTYMPAKPCLQNLLHSKI